VKTRLALEICLPLALFVAACALSLPTLLIAVAWMTIGVISLGHRALESFPTDGIRREWLRGYRGACLLFYHLAWWPWYMRSPLRDSADRAQCRFEWNLTSSTIMASAVSHQILREPMFDVEPMH
jgi:hypothetical protein